jgi:DNA polymerase
MAELLRGDLDANVRQVLELRAEAGRSSLSKLDSMLHVVGPDGRARGLLLMNGADTGRWAGRLIQPHNFMRPTVSDAEAFIDDILEGQYDLIDALYSPFEVVASLMRGMIRAGDGRVLHVADLSGIEARIVNWLAGQWDILERFARGDDVYMYNAIRRYGLPETATKKTHPVERQGGKAIELGAGFGMGWEKHRATLAKAPYFLNVTEEEARADIEFYRESHAAVRQLWYDVERAALHAVRKPGEIFTAGVGALVRYTSRGGYLWAILPSGRPLAYARPRIVDRPLPWDPKQTRPSVMVEGINQKTHQWGPYPLYGGLEVENLVQAIARDIMADGMRRVEAASFPVILTVHDEIVAEPEVGRSDIKTFVQLIEETPPWAERLPVAAEGWAGERYGK